MFTCDKCGSQNTYWRRETDIMYAGCYDCSREDILSDNYKESAVLTPIQFEAKIREIQADYGDCDPEAYHDMTDNLMEQQLEALGYNTSIIGDYTRHYS